MMAGHKGKEPLYEAARTDAHVHDPARRPGGRVRLVDRGGVHLSRNELQPRLKFVTRGTDRPGSEDGRSQGKERSMQDLTLTSGMAYLYKLDGWSEGRVVVNVWPVGETIMENFAVGRRNRPYQDWKPVVLQFLQSVTGLTNLSLRWSQKAGCSCGCSPGFFVYRIIDEDGTAERLLPRHVARALEPRHGRHEHWSNRVFDYRYQHGHELVISLDIAADDYVAANREALGFTEEDL